MWDNDMGWGMWGNDMGWGGWLLMTVTAVVFWAVVVFGIVALLRGTGGDRPRTGGLERPQAGEGTHDDTLRTQVRRLGSIVALGVVLASASASAAPADGATYGLHVRECAQVMGLDRDHNPGMHQGISRWEPAHSC